MNAFRTDLDITPSSIKINLQDRVLLIGSCFTNNIGDQLVRNKFSALVNPLGTIFNPLSINKLLCSSLGDRAKIEEGYGINGDIHFHYDFHSQFSSTDKNQLETKIAESLNKTADFIKSTKWLIITWGTAFVYENLNNKDIVANCHKMPASNFNKRLLTQEEIVTDFEKLISQLPADIQIILTISPVRHTKDTIELNSVSKSVLRLSSHVLKNSYSNVHYFPSFEIMMDDLRDYRFYASDMLHPNDVAIDFIWDKFLSTYFDETTKEFLVEWKKISNSLKHRPFNPTSADHQKFLIDIKDALNKLSAQVDVKEELKIINQQLNN